MADSERIDRMIDKMFIRYDKDSNGLLAKKQIAQLLSEEGKHLSRGPSTLAEAQEFLNAYDDNKDGYINREELKNMFMKMMQTK